MKSAATKVSVSCVTTIVCLFEQHILKLYSTMRFSDI